MQTREELEKKIKDLQDSLESYKDNYDPDDDEFEEMYDDMIRETCDTVTIVGLTFDPARIIREMDPTAYRCGKVDYLDSLELDEVPGYDDFKDNVEEEIAELEELIAELEDQDEE